MIEPSEICTVEEDRFTFSRWSPLTVGTYESWSSYLGSSLWWSGIGENEETGVLLKKKDGTIIPFVMSEYSGGYYQGDLLKPRSYFLLFSKPDGFKPVYGMVIWND